VLAFIQGLHIARRGTGKKKKEKNSQDQYRLDY